jgi:undecaprenyl-diphosphatase
MNPIDALDSGTDYWFHFQRNEGPLKEFLTPFMKIANALGSMPVQAMVAVAIMGLLLFLGRRRQAGALGVIVFVAVVCGEGLKWLVRATRPSDADVTLGPSFPNMSGLMTSMLMLILAMILSTLVRSRLRYLLYGLCLILVLWIGASQLYLGLHFLTDLVAGWTAGVMLALVWHFWTSPERERRVV